MDPFYLLDGVDDFLLEDAVCFVQISRPDCDFFGRCFYHYLRHTVYSFLHHDGPADFFARAFRYAFYDLRRNDHARLTLFNLN